MRDSIQAELNRLAADPSLRIESQLGARLKALDYLSFTLEVVAVRGEVGEWSLLGQQARSLITELTQINETLFQKTRKMVLSHPHQPLHIRAWFDHFTTYRAKDSAPLHIGPDALDGLWEGVLQIGDFGRNPLPEREPDMVHYEPTPARVILDLIDHLPWQPHDIFYDLGSGLGQVPIFFRLLTGCVSKGIEIEPDYCQFAQARAASLALTDIVFIEGDVREINFGDGSIFFLFTPFVGQMLQIVCDRLQQAAQRRIIHIATYGTCTTYVAQQSWLKPLYNEEGHDFKLGIYRSFR